MEKCRELFKEIDKINEEENSDYGDSDLEEFGNGKPIDSGAIEEAVRKIDESQAISRAFNKLWSDAGLPTECNPKPRAYDFRHHFAFANINRWVENRINVNGMLPYLMNHMGHSSIDSTFYYIHLIPGIFRSIFRNDKSPATVDKG
ncbi:hypothetical protein LJE72_23590 [Desulfosporosinus sp. SRJS8]|uniref:hypothetical protein n=1 Tax=Desulfosporosinus shakirovi TaxID=2885154 RepID=UPI001E48803D|nr:hypothetical protein [Desulfosporosinus sp. SRJS8]MCB8818464.1 hypothetical protein [Desulfosporosinus sp. SRJS8]